MVEWGYYANLADKVAVDTILRTYVWNMTQVECPDTLNHIYRGIMRFYVNSSTTASLDNSIAVLDQGTQVAGLEGMQSFLLCTHTAWKTHMQDVIIVIYLDNYTSIPSDGFDPSTVSEWARVESSLSFLHIKACLSSQEI